MILDQLRMGARQTIYAPLTADWKNYSQEQVAPANPLWGGCVQLKVPIWLSPRLISWFDCPFQSPPNGESVRSSSFCTRVSLPTVSCCTKSFLRRILIIMMIMTNMTTKMTMMSSSFCTRVSLPTVSFCRKSFLPWIVR